MATAVVIDAWGGREVQWMRLRLMNGLPLQGNRPWGSVLYGAPTELGLDKDRRTRIYHELLLGDYEMYASSSY